MLFRSMTLCVLSLFLFTGCYSQFKTHDPDAEAVVQKLVDTIVSGQRSQIAEMVSLPFWMDKWHTDLESVRAKLGGNEGGPKAVKMKLRLFPLSELAVRKPILWQELQEADPTWLADVVLAEMTLELNGKTEVGLLFLRKVGTQWRLAGLVEQ
ncbi:MAG: hypothetical protein AB7I41_03280 [Candidatus Sericytochromatia bacterium]